MVKHSFQLFLLYQPVLLFLSQCPQLTQQILAVILFLKTFTSLLWFLLWCHYFRTLYLIIENLLSECLILLSQSKYFLFVSISLLLHLFLRFLVLFYWYFGNLLRLLNDVFILSWTFQTLFPPLRLRWRSCLFGNVDNIFVLLNFVFIFSNGFFHLLYFAHLPSQFINEWLVLFLDEHVGLLEKVLHLVFPVFCLQLAA